ncbi:TonB-dependent receptor plug domain-containing protein [Thiomicrorhabdus xiamenensis]|uniref:TonB-dependent receptor n=1 Tax=Thiomicrorhabdus xiamenensis TaxID=2739063 RepID=A0A7D4NSB0_9GAMM|nr:TonB-dependent receptor [Thiomicrorhabdus xiamenensis]QKI89797.1 TonB-dependent receptor [Thiomicrorhabdus xiamenensis]
MTRPPFTKSALQHALLIASAFSLAGTAHAQDNVFKLGEITVLENDEPKTYSAVDSGIAQEKGDSNVGEAIQEIPGVTLQIGGRRAETRANIRGFDSRQITLNLDGIPIYVPYDGNIDLSRFLLGDLSQIEVTKSLGSMLEGPNNMGGSINLVTRRPHTDFEGDINASIEGGREGVFKQTQNARIGGIINENFYFQGGVSAVQADNFPLSADFQPKDNAGSIYQPEGERLRSGNENLSANLKLGYTPNSHDEYTLSYYQTEGSKESSPYAGTQDTVRYWDWPQWDKQSLYYVGYTEFGASDKPGYLKTRLFYDKFDNALNSYDDDQYNSVTKKYAFRSQYNDYSIGGSLEAAVPVDKHLLKTALFLKKDEHKERDLDSDIQDLDNSWRTFQSETASLGFEDRINITPQTQFTLGYRLDHYKLTKADDNDDATQPQGAQQQSNWQMKLDHDLGTQRILAGISLKSRFPNMKDQVSYRLGQAIPNLQLKAEKALHYELALLGELNTLRYRANAFYASIQDAIETVTVASDQCGSTTCDQNQNVGTASSKGFELQASLPLSTTLDLSLSYSRLIRDYADDAIVATYAPEHSANLSLDWFANSDWHLGLDGHYQSDSETRFDGSRPTDGFSLWDIRAHYRINKAWHADFALKNLLDADYEIAEGDPMPGRTFWANIQYQF